MGKTVNLIGGMTGKVGNVVYYIRNGVQTVRVYVPNPNNPKSSGQNAARLRMALAGKLSSVVPAEAILGLNGMGKSGRRSRFLRLLMGGVTVAGGTASVPDGGVVFSEGALTTFLGHSLSALTGDTPNTKGVTVTTTWPETAREQVLDYQERYVFLFLNNKTSMYDYAVTGLLNLPTAPGSSARVQTNVTFRSGDVLSEYTAIGYVYPFRVAVGEGGGRFRTSDLGVDENGVVIDLTSGEVVSGEVEYGSSLVLGRVVIPLPASGQ